MATTTGRILRRAMTVACAVAVIAAWRTHRRDDQLVRRTDLQREAFEAGRKAARQELGIADPRHPQALPNIADLRNTYTVLHTDDVIRDPEGGWLWPDRPRGPVDFSWAPGMPDAVPEPGDEMAAFRQRFGHPAPRPEATREEPAFDTPGRWWERTWPEPDRTEDEGASDEPA